MQPFKPQSDSVLENAPHGHEEADVAVNGILVFLAVLGASCLLVFVLCYGLRIVMQKYVQYTDPKPGHWQQLEQEKMEAQRQEEIKQLPPGKPIPNEAALSQREMSQIVDKDFPNPRLQTDTGDGADDLQAMRKREDARLNDYMWVDKASGRVTIPIEEAMQQLAKQGLPATGQTSTPPAPVTVNNTYYLGKD